MIRNLPIIGWSRRDQAAVGVLLLAQLVLTSCTQRSHMAESRNATNAAPSMEQPSTVDPASLDTVALIDGYDSNIKEAVEEELRAHDIVCYLYGSIVYAVDVARNDAIRARMILRDSKRINHERVRVFESLTDGKKR